MRPVLHACFLVLFLHLSRIPRAGFSFHLISSLLLSSMRDDMHYTLPNQPPIQVPSIDKLTEEEATRPNRYSTAQRQPISYQHHVIAFFRQDRRAYTKHSNGLDEAKVLGMGELGVGGAHEALFGTGAGADDLFGRHVVLI